MTQAFSVLQRLRKTIVDSRPAWVIHTEWLTRLAWAIDT